MPGLLNPTLTAQLQRRTSEMLYGDTAVILVDVDSGTVDSYNNPVVTTTSTAIDCSYTELSADEQWRTYGDIGIVTGRIRFASPAPTKGNLFRITKRMNGAIVTGNEMEIVSIEDRGDFGYVCNLKDVTL
jgi:hypothetical protein